MPKRLLYRIVQFTVLSILFAMPRSTIASAAPSATPNFPPSPFTIYLAGINDPNCFPTPPNSAPTQTAGYPEYCQTDANEDRIASEVTSTSNTVEERRVPPDGTNIRSRTTFAPQRPYVVYVTGTYTYAISTPFGMTTGTADAECTDTGLEHVGTSLSKSWSRDRWVGPSKFGFGPSAGKDLLDLSLYWINGEQPIGEWVALTPDANGCSVDHDYYAVITNTAIYPQDLQYMRVEASFSNSIFGVTSGSQQPGLELIIQRGDASLITAPCFPTSCTNTFAEDRKIYADHNPFVTYRDYNWYPCPKWIGEDWDFDGVPADNARALTGTVGEVASATVLVDTRLNYQEGLSANTRLNTFGSTGTSGFVRTLRADGTEFQHWEQVGSRSGIMTCNWVLPGNTYELEVSGTYLYHGGRGTWLKCGWATNFCVAATGTYVDFTPTSSADASYVPLIGCRPDPTVSTSTGNESTNTVLGSGFRSVRNGFTYGEPNWFRNTCETGVVWQCNKIPARLEGNEYANPSKICILREPDLTNDSLEVTHKGVTVVGGSTATAVPSVTATLSSGALVTYTATSTSVAGVTLTVSTAQSDAECATSPWALTDGNTGKFYQATFDRVPQDGLQGNRPLLPVDPQWRFNRVRGGFPFQDDVTITLTSEEDSLSDGPKTRPQKTGWFIPSFNNQGLPNWHQFSAGYYDWYDLYVDGPSLSSWQIYDGNENRIGPQFGWAYLPYQWRPSPGSALSLDRDDPQYGCSSTHVYKTYWSPPAAGPLILRIQDYDQEWDNFGHLTVRIRRLGHRSDVPWYRDWCLRNGVWTLGKVGSLVSGAESSCSQASLTIESLSADPQGDDLTGGSSVDKGEHLVVRNTGDVDENIQGWVLERRNASTGSLQATLTVSATAASSADYSIQERHALRLYVGCGTNTPGRLYLAGSCPASPTEFLLDLDDASYTSGILIVLKDGTSEVARFRY